MQHTRTIHHKTHHQFSHSDIKKWQAIILDWEQSKESQKTYCERMNLNLNTFTYMRGKLLAGKKKNNPELIEVKIKNDVKEIALLQTITIENNKGLKVQLPANINGDYLKTLLQLLGW